MIASSVLFNGHFALGTFLRVGRYPVGRLRVIVALLDPFLQQATLHRIVPILTALKAEHVTAFAHDGLCLDVRHLDGVRAVGRGTPA